MKYLVTGAAGFIGYHVIKILLQQNVEIVGLDNINDYYDVNLKYGRLGELSIPKEKIKDNICVKSDKYQNLSFIKADITNKIQLNEIFKSEQFDVVINLAAQAGVRYSLTNPQAYIDSNINGFLNILEACRHNKIKHLVYASSSSVYGLNKKMPFSTSHNVDHPISLYAASKKSNELMAHSYSYLFNLPTTGLRFFTVYGPWGRPDMALFIFTKAIIENSPIQIFNNGNMKRDFTYIDDIVEGILRVSKEIPVENNSWSGETPDPSYSVAPYSIYNIGNCDPVDLMDFVETIETELGKDAKKEFLPLQEGDVPSTWADTSKLRNTTNYQPNTPITKGVKNFINWYKSFYKL